MIFEEQVTTAVCVFAKVPTRYPKLEITREHNNH